MAIVTCSDCGAQISDRAAACVKCGAPIGQPSMMVAAAKPVTTQQTSKAWKVVQLVGMVMICAGSVSCSIGEPGPAATLWILGVPMIIVGRFGAWWSNG